MSMRKYWTGVVLTAAMGCSVAGQNGGSLVPSMPAPVAGVKEAPMAAPIMAEAVADTSVIRPAPIFEEALPAFEAGVLTAGDIDDGLNIAKFQRYHRTVARAISWPRMTLGAPLLAQLRDATGAPAPGVRVTLREPS